MIYSYHDPIKTIYDRIKNKLLITSFPKNLLNSFVEVFMMVLWGLRVGSYLSG